MYTHLRSFVICASTIILLLGTATTAAAAHPSAGYKPKPLNGTYGLPNHGLPSSWSVNDLMFIDDYPDSSALYEAEVYMIRGSEGSAYGRDLEPWYIVVQRHAINHFFKYGVIPQQLTPEVLAQTYNIDINQVNPEWIEEIKCPITGQFPMLNAIEFSPGNLYIRPLSTDEMLFIGNQSEWNYNVWFNNQLRDVETGEVLSSDLLGVFYTRVYGLNDVILVDLATLTR
jgi:hypothetical protein